MSKGNKDILGEDISSEGFAPKVKDAGKGITGKPLKRVSEGKSETVIGKADRKDSEPERIYSKIEKEGINKRLASAQVEGGKDLEIHEAGSGKSHPHGVVKAR